MWLRRLVWATSFCSCCGTADWKIQLAAVVVILVGLLVAVRVHGRCRGGLRLRRGEGGHAYFDGFQAHWNKNVHPAH